MLVLLYHFRQTFPVLSLALFCMLWLPAKSYGISIDSLHNELSSAKGDSSISQNLWNIGRFHRFDLKYDSAMFYYQKALDLLEGSPNANLLFNVIWEIGILYSEFGEQEISLEYNQRLIDLGLKDSNEIFLSVGYTNCADNLSKLNQHKKALKYNMKVLEIDKRINDTSYLVIDYSNIGENYMHLDQFESAMRYLDIAVDLNAAMPEEKESHAPYFTIGKLMTKIGSYPEARKNYLKAIEATEKTKNYPVQLQIQFETAKMFKAIGNKDSSIHFASLALERAKELNFPNYIMNIAGFLYGLDSSDKYLEIYESYSDSVEDLERMKSQTLEQIKQADINAHLRGNESEGSTHRLSQPITEDTKTKSDKNLTYLLVGLGLTVMATLLLYFRKKIF